VFLKLNKLSFPSSPVYINMDTVWRIESFYGNTGPVGSIMCFTNSGNQVIVKENPNEILEMLRGEECMSSKLNAARNATRRI
jgi:hypothetical protein